MKKILLFPCSGNAFEAVECLGDAFEPIGFIDDDAKKQGGKHLGLPCFGREALGRHPEALVLAVPGNPENYRGRAKLISALGVAPERFATVIHPRASVSPHARIGRNTLLMAGVVVTSNARVGDHVCILPNSVIHHDSEVGDYSLVGSNVTVAGGAHLGANCYIGSGSNVMNGVKIGEAALVGLGSNVIRSVPKGARVVGNPARPLSEGPGA